MIPEGIISRSCGRLLLGACLAVALTACGGPGESPQEYDGPAQKRTSVEMTPISQLNAGESELDSHAGLMSRSVLVKDFRRSGGVAKSLFGDLDPEYLRLLRTADGSYLMIYTKDGYVYTLLSPDLKTWEPQGAVLEKFYFTNFRGERDARYYMNGDAVLLADGSILLSASFRAFHAYAYEEGQQHGGIVIIRSTDNGRSWSDPQEIYHGTNWEPMMIQIPSGQIQCYFSESRPWISGGHSGSGMVWSDDNGLTWQPDRLGNPRTVVRQQYVHHDSGLTLYTDQMPAVIRLNNGSYAGIFESAVQETSSYHKISMAWSPELWPELTGDELGPADRANNLYRGSAPSILQFPSGETVFSYGSTYLYGRMGDQTAHGWSDAFKLLPGKGSMGAIELIGSHEMAAIMHDSDNVNTAPVGICVYVLNHAITAASHEVAVDGRNRDWPVTDEALFVGSLFDAQATLRCSVSGGLLHFLVEVSDLEISSQDYVTLTVAPYSGEDPVFAEGAGGVSAGLSAGASATGSSGAVGAVRIMSDCRGSYVAEGWSGGEWQESKAKIKIRGAYNGTIDDNEDYDEGWICEAAIPLDALPVSSASGALSAGSRLLVRFSLTKGGTTEDASSWQILSLPANPS